MAIGVSAASQGAVNDRAMIATLLEWRAAGHGITLLTAARAWGPTPRPAGTLMAVRDDGATAGTFGSTAMETMLLSRTQRALSAKPLRVACPVGPVDAERYGSGQDGRMEVIMERLRDNHGFEQLHSALTARRPLVRRLGLADGTVEIRDYGDALHCDDHWLERRFTPAWRLVIIGATETANHLIHCAAALDYEVILCEPRDAIRAAWNLRDTAHGLVVDPRPTEVVAALADDEHSAFIALTGDHRLDAPAVASARAGKCFFVGGAERHASYPPPELAIALLAEVAAARRGKELAATGWLP